MDKNLFSLAYLLQSGYTHIDLKEVLFSGMITPEYLWEETKK
jgi:hypothetical protein